jgi:hypothetical protein
MAYVQKPGRGCSAKTGNGIPSALLQVKTKVDAQVDEMIADLKNERIRKSAEAARTKLESSQRKSEANAYMAKKIATEKQAVSDSATVDNKMRKAGFGELASYMGNKKANEVRQQQSASNYHYDKVEMKHVGDRRPKRKVVSSPLNQKVSKKTAYDIKEASNQKLKPSARKHYAENAQAAMKNKKKK